LKAASKSKHEALSRDVRRKVRVLQYWTGIPSIRMVKRAYIGDVKVPVFLRKASDDISRCHEDGASCQHCLGTEFVDQEHDGGSCDKE
jgi:hypothetical protein